MMRFDVVIGNPPYQLGDNGHFYRQFIDIAKKHTDCICMVIPSSYFGDISLFKEIEHYHYNGMNFANVELATSWFIWRRDHTSGTTVHFDDGSVHVKDVKTLPTQDKKLFEITNDIQSKEFQTWKIYGGNLWRKDAILDPNGVWCIWTSGRAGGDFDKSKICSSQSELLSGFGKHKVIFTEITSHDSLGNIKYAPPDHGCAGGTRYIEVENELQAKNLINYLNSDLVKMILKSAKSTTKHNTQTVINYIPKIPLS